MTKRTALARARRGAALLDAKYKNWRKKIDLDHLNMARGTYDGRENSCGCILAQVDLAYRPRASFGSWSRAAERLGLYDGSRSQHIHGFLADEDDDYELLDEAWKTVLS